MSRRRYDYIPFLFDLPAMQLGSTVIIMAAGRHGFRSFTLVNGSLMLFFFPCFYHRLRLEFLKIATFNLSVIAAVKN